MVANGQIGPVQPSAQALFAFHAWYQQRSKRFDNYSLFVSISILYLYLYSNLDLYLYTSIITIMFVPRPFTALLLRGHLNFVSHVLCWRPLKPRGATSFGFSPGVALAAIFFAACARWVLAWVSHTSLSASEIRIITPRPGQLRSCCFFCCDLPFRFFNFHPDRCSAIQKAMEITGIGSVLFICSLLLAA